MQREVIYDSYQFSTAPCGRHTHTRSFHAPSACPSVHHSFLLRGRAQLTRHDSSVRLSIRVVTSLPTHTRELPCFLESRFPNSTPRDRSISQFPPPFRCCRGFSFACALCSRRASQWRYFPLLITCYIIFLFGFRSGLSSPLSLLFFLCVCSGAL